MEGPRVQSLLSASKFTARLTHSVPSSSGNGMYEVRADVGLCTCWVGRQGAFCKHQALVQQNFGGPFPNSPALTQADCRDLGHLALGDQCPPAEFFGPFGSFQHYAPSTHPGPSKTQASPISVEAMEVTEEVPSSGSPAARLYNPSQLQPVTAAQR
uniref:SWIM-type domain-containing protein n=1 Tax=Rhipicephalus zambeziensis TaxID=60191 RepID=A0A224YQZ4_9ACAR